VNVSEYLFTVSGDDIYFGLGAIKGVGESALNAIFEAREKLPDKKFKSLEDFFAAVDPKKLNKKVLECLIKAGAFDDFGYHRAQLISGYQKFLERAEVARNDMELGQASLFDLGPATESKVVLDPMKPWSRTQFLANEKEVLGFYLSDHPLKGFENLAAVWVTGRICDLPRIGEEHKAKMGAEKAPVRYDPRNRDAGKKRVVVAGLITEARELITKKGTRMAFAKIEDLSGTCELVIFPDAFARNEALIKDERPMLIGGLLEVEEGNAKIMVDTISPIEEALKKTKRMVLHLDLLESEDYPKLQSVLAGHPGPTRVELVMNLPELGKKVIFETEVDGGVQVSNEFLESIHSQFGKTDFIEMSLT
jgi:DNA polymerase-3 subunit alpha